MLQVYEEAGIFFSMEKDKKCPVVIFGAGERGKIWSNFLQNMGVKFFAACDNQKTGMLKNHYLENQYPQEYFPEETIQIIKPEDLEKATEYFIVVSSDSEEAQRAIIDQLNSLNVRGCVFLGKSYQNFVGGCGGVGGSVFYHLHINKKM